MKKSKNDLRFELTDSQFEKLQKWIKKQDKEVLEKDGEVYYGAIGGEITYKFSPTSLGDILVVYHSGTKDEINLTEYENW